METLLEKWQKEFKESLNPIGWYMWLCSLEVTNCEECKQHDGQIFKGKNLPDYPAHYGCYCTIAELPIEYVVEHLFKNSVQLFDENKMPRHERNRP
jgi:hypothetical protein